MIGRRLLWQSSVAGLDAASSRPGWRQGGGKPSGGARRTGPNWSERRPGPSWEGKAARVAALVLLGLSVPALVVAWVWLFPDRQPTPMLVIAASSYEAPCPPNAFALDDAERFEAELAEYDNVRVTRAAEPRSSVDLLESVTDFLGRAQPGGPDQNVVLVYLSVHGVVDDQGRPCLLLPGHDPLDARDWLPAAELFETIAKARTADDGAVVVLLDAQRIDDAWQMGVLANTFSSAVEALLAEAPPTGCVVIAAASGLQTSAASPEIGGTAFGYFTARGLRGEADANRDAYVTLAELEEYLRERVDAWAWQHRGVRQQPHRVAGDGVAVRLADVAGVAQIAEQPWKSPIGPQEFQEVFDRVRALEESRVFVLNPLGWAKVQDLLVRLDAEALGGKAYQAQARDNTLRTLVAVVTELESERPYRDLQPYSLAWRERLDPASESVSLDAAWEAWRADPAKNKVPPGYDAAAASVWKRLAQGDGTLSRDELAVGLQFCDLAGQPARDEFTELAFVRLLDRCCDWPSPALASGIPRQLLAAQRESELLAAPVDARQHYIVAGPLAPLDQSLALAFDGAVVSGDESLHQSDEALSALLGDGPQGYRRVARLSEQTLEALRTRDQALAAAAYLNEWWVRRGRHDRSSRSTLDVRPLVRDALELAAYLDEATAQADADPAVVEERLGSLAARVDSTLEALMSAHADRVDEVTVLEEGSQGSLAVETPELLRCPVRAGEGRARLHKVWLERVAAQSTPAATSEVPDQASAGDDDLQYLRWVATDGVVPLHELLDEQRRRDGTANDSAARVTLIDGASPRADVELALAELGGRVRARLSGLPTECQRLAERTTDLWGERSAAEARTGLAQADLLCRSLAPLAAPTLRFKSGEAPAERLRELDAQAWVLWYGQRALDACWGTWERGVTIGEPYCLRVAALAAGDAEQLLPESRFGVDELRQRIRQSDEIIRKWQPLAADDVSIVDEGGGYKRHRLQFQGDADMRPGVVGIYLSDEVGDLFQTYTQNSQAVRRTAASMRDDAALDNWLSIEELGDVPTLTARAMFRGHIRFRRFSVGQGVLVDWQRPPAADASVVVAGDSKQISQIVFIFDCSGSMTRARIEDAREAMADILRRLIDQGEQFRVGLILYGRRAGWKKNEKTGRYEIVRASGTEYNGHPRDDVELAFHPTQLDKNFAAQINKHLELAAPLGETPLYYSLSIALQEFDPETPGPRRIIAITDGVDELVFDQGEVRERKYNLENVQAAMVRLPTQIDVFEFGVDWEKLDEAEKKLFESGRESLEKLTASTKPPGAWRRAKEKKELEDSLLASLRLDRYRLQGPDAEAEYAELGSKVTVPGPPSPTEYQVDLESHDAPSAEIQVEGGEALKLTYRRTPVNHLVHEIYDPPSERGAPLLQKGFRIASHTPRLLRNDAIFRVSIQSDDERRFSRRPEVIWAKVEAVDEENPRPYFFMDRDFEPGLPVPMVNLRARSWSGGDFASVELAFVAEADSLQPQWIDIPRLGEVRRELHDAALDVRMAEIPGEGYQVVVDEEHGADSKDYPLHLQLDPPADRVSRTFFDANRSVHHVFFYEVDRADPKLRVLTRREIEAAGVSVKYDRVELGRQ